MRAKPEKGLTSLVEDCREKNLSSLLGHSPGEYKKFANCKLPDKDISL